jgi:hypothetical protein
MRHLSEGVLRRMYDDPDAMGTDERAHFASCPACQHRFQRVGDDARQVRAAFEVTPVPADPHAAFARVQARLHDAPARHRAPRVPAALRRPLSGLGWRKPALATGLAAALAAVLTLTPLAANLQQLLQPNQVQPISLSQQDLDSLHPLGSYGTVTWQQKPERHQAASAAAAAQATGLPQLQPSNLPKSVAGLPAAYYTMNQANGSFTFSEAKARQAAQQAGKPAPAFPSGVDGSTLVLQTGPGEGVVYGDQSKLQQAQKQRGQSSEGALQQAGPVFAVGEMRVPTLSSTGVTVAQLKQTLLAQPGLTPQAQRAIQALDSPSGTLPIPIPADQAQARPVTVQGVQGQAFGDDTGLGAGVVWIKDGVVHLVGGTVSQAEVLAVAQNLR